MQGKDVAQAKAIMSKIERLDSIIAFAEGGDFWTKVIGGYGDDDGWSPENEILLTTTWSRRMLAKGLTRLRDRYLVKLQALGVTPDA